MIEQELNQLGFSESEQSVYLALLKLGPSPVIPIAKQSGVTRTATYFVLDRLAQKGVVTSVTKRNKQLFAVEPPQRLLTLLDGQKENLEQELKSISERKKRIEQIVPELTAMLPFGNKPKVRYFEGEEGVKSAFADTLDQKPGSEILMYTTTNGFYQQVPGYLDSYIQKRVKQDIHVRLVLPDEPLSLEYIKHDTEQLRTTRTIPADRFMFSNEIDIYDNKVAIISLEKEWLAVIIESESIAKTQRAIFELAWEAAEKYQIKV